MPHGRSATQVMDGGECQYALCNQEFDDRVQVEPGRLDERVRVANLLVDVRAGLDHGVDDLNVALKDGSV